MFDITNEIYAEKAHEHLEAIHWPNGPICPHCGNCDATTITKLAGKSTRPGVYKCNACRDPFTVTVGTVFERSKIALNKWVLAAHLTASSKKGMSAHQLHRMLGVTYKTAWLMAHRIREAMKEDVKSSGPLGGGGKTVEADETYIGKRETPRKLARGRIAKPTKDGKSGGADKRIVVGLVERSGKSRMFHLNEATPAIPSAKSSFATCRAIATSTPMKAAFIRSSAKNSKRIRRRSIPLRNIPAAKATLLFTPIR